jgi:putative transposase
MHPIDLGITSLIALSTGEKIANPKAFKAKRHKLRKAQKALSRKQKGSKNRYKASLKVAKIHGEISDARQDFFHKLTTRLVRDNQTIAVEDLAVKNMIQNHKLALAISDASWGELVRQLEYKCDWYGRTFVKIDRWFPSSKRCDYCGHIVDKLPLNIREWDCPKCSTKHDRDINAATNILAAGLAVAVRESEHQTQQGCIWRKANMFVGAKHDRIQYGIITNNLSAVMLRPPQKPDAPPNRSISQAQLLRSRKSKK